MSIVRAARKSQFYTLPTATIEDDRLSWEARGLLVYLLSKPDKWVVQPRDLVNRTKNAIGKSAGKDKVYSIINELRAAGYIYREFKREGGNFVGVDYEVSETPDLEAAEEYRLEREAKANPPFPDLPETVVPVTASAETPLPITAKPETLDKTQRASRIEKAGKNTGDLVQPENYPANPASKSYAAWHAYASAYRERYKQWPLYNRTVAGQICKMVDRVGEQAPSIAAFYVSKEHAGSVVDKCHPVSLLLHGCEGYATKAALAEKSQKRAGQVQALATASVHIAPPPALATEATPAVNPSVVGRAALDQLLGKARISPDSSSAAGGAQ
ncbi:hypothetical protein [Pseudomonas atacamensis]|uniref:hypothetical protein n=1 Tax=Pseudomonas atacamensis TaxID=2565368 RepID=UPI0019D03ED9|nr:hypothetical protein [Pseudomonas atacamensis]QSL90464.1 hypothetical protein JWU58_26870 [Pseudomonas atacamensis]